MIIEKDNDCFNIHIWKELLGTVIWLSHHILGLLVSARYKGSFFYEEVKGKIELLKIALWSNFHGLKGDRSCRRTQLCVCGTGALCAGSTGVLSYSTGAAPGSQLLCSEL